MLKAIVDETSHGKYDFMYLRIGKVSWLAHYSQSKLTLVADFANNCKCVKILLLQHLIDCYADKAILASATPS
jgi:hypothetical protein